MRTPKPLAPKQRVWVAALCLILGFALIAAIVMESTLPTPIYEVIPCPSNTPSTISVCEQTVAVLINWSSPAILIQLIVAVILFLSAIVMFL